MMKDYTFDVLERAVGSLLNQDENIALACEHQFLEDNYEGFIVQSRIANIDILDNAGKAPVLATYEVEITYTTDKNVVFARMEQSGGALKTNISLNIEDAIISHLPVGAKTKIINVSMSTTETSVSESNRYVFSTTLQITLNPIIGKDEDNGI